MKKQWIVSAFICAVAHGASAQQAQISSPLGFTSSVASLQQTFDWAKGQALVYSRSGTAGMGPWFEAALPGRNAFCIRDASHQSEGAAALGLYGANENILHRYAASIAESRDWAGYWEIDGTGQPSPEDYASDTDFWFNLPANFDAIDAVVRAWRWTGNDRYRSDPVFQRLFRTALRDYIRTWQLTPENILKRPRIANQKQAEGRFVNSRGIPSYSEGPKDFIFGTDLLAAEYRAILAFQQIANTPQDRALARQSMSTAKALQPILERVAWSEAQQHYLGTIHHDLTGSGSGDALLLYFGAIGNSPHRRAALDYISAPAYWKTINIEEESYLPLTLFRYDRVDAAYKILADLSSPTKPRRDYPEVSYAVLESIVSGVMGLRPSLAQEHFDVTTRSQLPAPQSEATLSGVAIKKNLLTVTHTGTSTTRMTNTSGPALRWRAAFAGTVPSLSVNGNSMKTQHSKSAESLVTTSWVDVEVGPGESVLIRKDAADGGNSNKRKN